MVSGETGFAKVYEGSQEVRSDSTATTLSDDSNPSQVGEWVTFVAMVTPNGLAAKAIPTGTVQFTLDGSRAGEPIELDSKGRAKWETSRLNLGEHRLTATYTPSPGSAFLASSSLEEIHTVERCLCGSRARDK